MNKYGLKEHLNHLNFIGKVEEFSGGHILVSDCNGIHLLEVSTKDVPYMTAYLGLDDLPLDKQMILSDIVTMYINSYKEEPK